MSHVHGSNLFRRRRLFQKRIDRFMVNSVEEILKFRESLIQKRSQLNLCRSTLLHKYLTETTEVLEVHEINILLIIEPMRLHHKGLGNQKRVNAIRFCLANVVFSHGRRLDRINDTNMKMPGNEEFDKVIAVVSR